MSHCPQSLFVFTVEHVPAGGWLVVVVVVVVVVVDVGVDEPGRHCDYDRPLEEENHEKFQAVPHVVVVRVHAGGTRRAGRLAGIVNLKSDVNAIFG